MFNSIMDVLFFFHSCFLCGEASVLSEQFSLADHYFFPATSTDELIFSCHPISISCSLVYFLSCGPQKGVLGVLDRRAVVLPCNPFSPLLVFLCLCCWLSVSQFVFVLLYLPLSSSRREDNNRWWRDDV